MASVNKVFLLGNLGRDPELRYSTNGNAVANFTVATSRKWKNSEGEVTEETEWHRCVAFGKTAEIAGEYLTKGSQCHIEGHLKTRQWEDKDGVTRYTTEIMVDHLTFVARSKGGSDDDDEPQRRPARRARPSKPDRGMPEDMQDDIPF